MKSFIAIIALFAVIIYASALPIESEKNELESVDSGSMINSQAIITRNKRFTCDVFSFESGLVTPNDSVCAAKCIGMNRRGGHCENYECICRQDKIIESLP
ncbi:hypothetical protein PV325_011461 [Microctonus aethiopoides]|uniref:Invertebrate defensins family profile domain-containing protein n=1 Tax=Microctonus aethiopoides TaxID=144406 RepID=A0AA39KJY5_9HYME|nr:hypothetical protein PV325_011461 [Microctonus aethiopoides]KAK0092305.1 hypothetical protein PV326_001730 [Microctonus aethiopoides]KAK0164273.1 hypothetical protein PV328_002919 [Microctonus aethiopoides]